jgi:hypothetical protein
MKINTMLQPLLASRIAMYIYIYIETAVPDLTQHHVAGVPAVPLRFFNRVSPVDVLWNFSAQPGSVPPFVAGTIVDGAAVQAMILAVGVFADWHRNRMTMGSVLNKASYRSVSGLTGTGSSR